MTPNEKRARLVMDLAYLGSGAGVIEKSEAARRIAAALLPGEEPLAKALRVGEDDKPIGPTNERCRCILVAEPPKCSVDHEALQEALRRATDDANTLRNQHVRWQELVNELRTKIADLRRERDALSEEIHNEATAPLLAEIAELTKERDEARGNAAGLAKANAVLRKELSEGAQETARARDAARRLLADLGGDS